MSNRIAGFVRGAALGLVVGLVVAGVAAVGEQLAHAVPPRSTLSAPVAIVNGTTTLGYFSEDGGSSYLSGVAPYAEFPGVPRGTPLRHIAGASTLVDGGLILNFTFTDGGAEPFRYVDGGAPRCQVTATSSAAIGATATTTAVTFLGPANSLASFTYDCVGPY